MKKYKNIVFLDFECTFQVDDRGKKNPAPYIPDNYLVSVGWAINDGPVVYDFFRHNEINRETQGYEAELAQELQDVLNIADLVVAHHSKFEKQWLEAVGLHYDGPMACTMIREYVLARGQKLGVGLADSCIRNNVENKKSDLIEGYLKKNIGFEQIPMNIVREYGIGDVISCRELYYNQLQRLAEAEHLWPTIDLMEEFAICLADIENNGIKIDVVELDRLEKEYTKELNQLKLDLQVMIKDVMGATPINLDSPEDLSQVLYSRRVKDKKLWKETFNLGSELRGSVRKPKRKTRMSEHKFVQHVREQTEIVYKTTAEQCETCEGKGYVRKVKTNGDPFKRTTVCVVCSGLGVRYKSTKAIAGFKLIPRGYEDTAVGGFTTDNKVLEVIALNSSGTAKEFLTKIQRANSIGVYLSSFIGGIRRGIQLNDICHPNFNQCIAATGRLTSSNPNWQNQPRGGTFPIRKCVISRFENGVILEGDFSQLEFRVAGELSNDKQIFEDIANKIDVHSNTAKWTGFTRQESKPYTFRPVYGGGAKGQPEHIARYITWFQEHYNGLFTAHKEWQNRVLNEGSYILPSGREFIYPNTVRYNNGNVSNSTTIANYPVQAFATADLVPIAVIYTWQLFKQYELKSKIILTVHDSIEIDCHPNEIEICIKLLAEGMACLKVECLRRYNYELKMALAAEYKLGENWLELKDIEHQR